LFLASATSRRVMQLSELGTTEDEMAGWHH